jgi:hypothetical protein
MRTTRTTKQALAVMVVATVLCAEHVVTATPMSRPQAARPEPVQVPQVVQMVSRLAQRFRQIVPSAVLPQDRQPQAAVTQATPIVNDQSLEVAALPLSPFQFRLPPPTLPNL